MLPQEPPERPAKVQGRPGKRAAAIALGGLLLACASAPSSPPAADGEVAERLYRGHCAACHHLLDPGEYTAEWWARAVGWFGPQAHLTQEEQRLVLGWLAARAKKPPPEDGGSP